MPDKDIRDKMDSSKKIYTHNHLIQILDHKSCLQNNKRKIESGCRKFRKNSTVSLFKIPNGKGNLVLLEFGWNCADSV